MKPLNEYGIDHVGFIVPDLEEAVRHVEEQYGVKSVVRMSPYLQHAWTRGVDHPQQCKCAMVTLADHSCKLEFLEPVTEGGYHWDYIQAGGRGINHICFKVHDFDHWQEHFRALGHNLFFGYEDEDQENGYRRCLYARDPVLDMVYEIKEINRYRYANGVQEEGKG